jgi:hypothetical protein
MAVTPAGLGFVLCCSGVDHIPVLVRVAVVAVVSVAVMVISMLLVIVVLVTVVVSVLTDFHILVEMVGAVTAVLVFCSVVDLDALEFVAVV